MSRKPKPKAKKPYGRSPAKLVVAIARLDVRIRETELRLKDLRHAHGQLTTALQELDKR